MEFGFFFSILENYKHIREKNEFIANSLKYLKFGEISIWILVYININKSDH